VEFIANTTCLTTTSSPTAELAHSVCPGGVGPPAGSCQ